MIPQRLRAATLLLGAKAGGAVSERLAGWFAARLWFTPWAVPRSDRALAREAAWLAPTTPRTWAVDGHRLQGFEAGDGPTILLVHGWGDRSAVLGAFVAPLVERGYRVAGFDLPAHGDSGRGHTDIPEVARAIAAVAAKTGDVAAVIAHSLGGAATVAALGAGLAADRVVLLAPPVRLDHAVTTFTQLFGLPATAEAGLRAHIERRFGPTVWKEFANDAIAASLDVPALIVHDADDPQIDAGDAQLLADAWPDARLLQTSGLGHRRILWDPDVVEEVVSFLAPSTAGRRGVPDSDSGRISAARTLR